jgi:hypothetical protein
MVRTVDRRGPPRPPRIIRLEPPPSSIHTTPATLDARAEISRLRAQGYGILDIARSLNARGVPTRSGRGRWHEATVRRYLDKERWNAYMRDYRRRQA